jgi:glycosyltransferase involved in cell wall biosynthesis
MKLCFVVQRYGEGVVGGAERYVESLASGLAADGHDVSVITSCATSYSDWADEFPPGTVEQSGVTVHRLPVRSARDNDRFIPLHLRAVDAFDTPLWPWAQDRWSQTMGPDLLGGEELVAAEAQRCDVTVLVGYHYAQTLRLTGIAAAFGPTIVIPTAHPEGAFHVGWVGHMFDHADHVVCLAHEEADLVRTNHPQAREVTVVPCPVEPIDRPDDRAIAETLAAYGLTGVRYAVVVGRVDPAKGSDDAVRFSRWFRRCVDDDFELVVVGPGGDDVGGDGVRPTGFVDEATKLALVAASEVVVQPSYMESFSLALMEGWLLGRPALVQRRSRVLAGHVARSSGGVAYHDYFEFEAALTMLGRHPGVAADMGAAGRAYVLREFAWTKVSAEFLEVARRAADSGGRRLSAAARVSR